MDIKQLSLTKLIDKGTLRMTLEFFSSATGMSVTALDRSEPVSSAQWLYEPDFCRNCMKSAHEGAERCRKYAAKCVEAAAGTSHRVINTCHAGITMFAVPVVVEGTHMGTLLGGQTVTEAPDMKKLGKLAHDLSINPDKLIAAFKTVDRVPLSRVEAAADLLLSMVEAMAETGYKSLVSAEKGQLARESISDVSTASYRVKQKIDATVNYVRRAEQGCERIKTAAAASARAVDNTDNIVKIIEAASTQLTLIGFNASIEAKRAGASGVGFNVIAQEVRSLSDKNTKQAGEIGNTLNGIKKSMNDINNQIRTLYLDIEKIVDSINDLSCEIADSENDS